MQDIIYRALERFKIVFVVLLLLLASCEEIIQQDISDAEILLIAPPDKYVSPTSQIQLAWSSVDGADLYELEVVRPTFDSIIRFYADTLLSAQTLTLDLGTGSYEWRVRGVNNAYETGWAVRSFVLDSTESLTGSQIYLSIPQNNYVTSVDSIRFEWSPISTASDYRFELRSGSTGELLADPVITTSTILDRILTEGIYTWGVQGQNTNSSTLFAYRNLTIDQTSPSNPLLIVPINDLVLNSDTIIGFNWSSGTDNLSEVIDSIFFSTNLNFSNTLYARAAFPPFNLSSDTLLLNTNYYWKVKSIDAAGNVSESDFRRFRFE